MQRLLLVCTLLAFTSAHFGRFHPGFFEGREGFFRPGPPFLRNVTRQAAFQYYQITNNGTLTKAQTQAAVDNWSAANNVTAEVTAFTTQLQQQQNATRTNVNAAVAQLPSVLTQIYSIEDNQNLTVVQERQQIGSIFANLTFPLNVLVGSALKEERPFGRK